MLPRIKEFIISKIMDKVYESKSSELKFYSKNIRQKDYTAQEFYILYKILNGLMSKENQNPTYEGALDNQTVKIVYDRFYDVTKNHRSIKSTIDKMVERGIIKKMQGRNYLINPIYAEYVTRKQLDYVDRIIDEEFPMYKRISTNQYNLVI